MFSRTSREGLFVMPHLCPRDRVSSPRPRKRSPEHVWNEQGWWLIFVFDEFAIQACHGHSAHDVVGRLLVTSIDDVALSLVGKNRLGRGIAEYSIGVNCSVIKQNERFLDLADMLASRAT